MKPDSLCAPLSGDRGVEYWKFSAKDIVQQCTFSCTLSSKNGYIGIRAWVFIEILAK